MGPGNILLRTGPENKRNLSCAQWPVLRQADGKIWRIKHGKESAFMSETKPS